jgi:cytochrome c oxidase cbb3-type subunit 3
MKVLLFPTMLVMALSVVGCGRSSADIAAAAAEPAIRPVGPVPGVGREEPRVHNPYGSDDVAITQGRQLFVQMNCAGCHGGRAGGGMGPSLRDQDWLYGSSDEHIFDSIAEGRGEGMPAWGTRLPADQIWRIVAYIKSLRTTREPQAPS